MLTSFKLNRLSSTVLRQFIALSNRSNLSSAMALSVDNLTKLYRDFAKVPIPQAGQISWNRNLKPNLKTLRVSWEINDMDKLKSATFVRHYLVALADNLSQVESVIPTAGPVDISNELAIAWSSNEAKFQAIVRSEVPKEGSEKQWLEIWDEGTRVKAIDISELKEHGNIIVDNPLANLIWSPDGKHLLYVAEFKHPTAKSFYKKDEEQKNDDAKNPVEFGQEFIYKEDWGESMDGVRHTVAAVLDTDTWKIKVAEVKQHSIGEPFWIKSGQQIGFIAWSEEPFRLGLSFCTNRRNAIYSFDLLDDKAVPKIIYAKENITVRLPRVNSSGSEMIFLENKIGSSHFKESGLMHLNLADNSSRTIIDTDGKRKIKDGNVYGDPVAIYIPFSLQQNCFTSTNKHVLLNCHTELNQKLFAISLEKKTIKVLETPTDSATILDFNDDILVVAGSSINSKPNVFVAKINENNFDSLKWIKVNDTDDLVPGIAFSSFSIPSDDNSKLISAILVSPEESQNSPAPVIVMPHGGPNHCFVKAFAVFPILFAKFGWKTLLVNYRGSIGVDKEYLESLIDKIGDFDVKDTVASVKYCSEQNLVDMKNLVLYGGSHGGFVVTHLSGQFHYLDFRACICANPVTDLTTFDASDIPDWTYAYALKTGEFDYPSIISEDNLKALFDKSPMKWINQVKVPTLMLLGQNDRRVPHNQGKKYYNILKSKGVDAKCFVYPDRHSLAKANVLGDRFVHISLWIDKYLNKQ